jgi:hypothetical protein
MWTSLLALRAGLSRHILPKQVHDQRRRHSDAGNRRDNQLYPEAPFRLALKLLGVLPAGFKFTAGLLHLEAYLI